MITSMAFQRNPDPILWCTLSDGTLISMTYEREQNVIGWAKHPIGIGSATESTAYSTPAAYPTLQVADGTFGTRQADPGLTRTTAISDVLGLQHMADNLAGNYYLTANIDASDTASWNGGAGFVPVGNNTTPFNGTLDGCGYTISGLTINRNSTYQGLFGQIGHSGASGSVAVANLTLTGVNIQCSGGYCGGLAGVIDGRSVVDCYVSGTVKAIGSTVQGMGGFVGKTDGTTTEFYDCRAAVTVDASTGHTDTTPEQVAGFVGDAGGTNLYDNCRASGTVTCQRVGGTTGNEVGGFVGYGEEFHTFRDCSATGNVTGGDKIGGFAGDLSVGCTIERCSAHGNVTSVGSASGAGGLIGTFDGTGGHTAQITDSYASGNVTAPSSGYAGGFIQYLYGDAHLTNVYASGDLSGGYVGGLVQWADITGAGSPELSVTFWDTESTGIDDAIQLDDGVEDIPTGHLTAWMQTKANYENAGWDFSTVWSCPDPISWTGLEAQSVTVIPSTNEDEVWIVVARVINGSTVRYLEQFQPRDWGDDQHDCWFVDSGLAYDGVADTTFSGLDHLEGEEVAILADGAIMPRQTVTNGSITLANAASRVIAGLPFRWKLKPMRFDINTGASTTQTAIKNIPEAIVSFYKTLGVKYGKDMDNLFDLDFRTTEAMGSPPAVWTGDKLLTPEGGFDSSDSLILTSDDPTPCTVRAIIPRILVTGR